MVKNLKKRLAAAALAATILAGTAGASVLSAAPMVFAETSEEIQQDINDLKAQQESLKQQQEEVQSKLASLKADESKQLEYKQALDEKMVAIQEEINVINKKIKKLDKKIKEKQAEIKDEEDNITKTFTQLKDRIRSLYLAGEASDLEILLNANSIADFAEKAELMRSITDHDTELINTLKEQLASVKVQKQEIEEARKEVSEAKNELESKKEEVEGLVQESNAVIAALRESQAEASATAASLDAEFNATSDSLKTAYQEYQKAKTKEQREAEAAAAAQVKQVTDDDYDPSYTGEDNVEEPAPDTGGGSDPVSTGEGTGTAYGQFIWPAPGTSIITSGVGPRWGRNHNGIDISGASCYGNPIVAADGGTVITAVHSGWGGGYGLHVMIDHGNGYVTVYGHASSVLVNTGQKVSQGQTIAYIGSTGDSTGPHLHFEIRLNGGIMDPENYVRA